MAMKTKALTVQDAAKGKSGGAGAVEVFSFGDPEPILDRSSVWSYFEMWQSGKYYEPPVPMESLAKSFNLSAHHRTAIGLKINMLLTQHAPTRWLTSIAFERWALDFLQMANAYMEAVPNMAGGIAVAKPSPALKTRVGVEPGSYFFVDYSKLQGGDHEYQKGTIFHLLQPDVAQEIYGMPEWIASLQSMILNEDATLFRRKYYRNGAHLGFVMSISDTIPEPETVEALKKAFKDAKGPGNFRNLLLYMPGGSKDGVKITPIADITAKDEFTNIKDITRDDMLAAHRTPPQLVGIIPKNSGGFGDVGKARDTFYMNEIIPIIRRMLGINDFFRVKMLTFNDYVTVEGHSITETGQVIPAGTR
jgi:PBSX family phage portal protein